MKGYFIIDLLSAIPFDMFVNYDGEFGFLILFPLLKILRLYRLKKIITYLRGKNIDVYIGVHPISKINYEANNEKVMQLKSLINLLNENKINLFNELVIIDDKDLSTVFFDEVHYSKVLAQEVINQLYK